MLARTSVTVTFRGELDFSCSEAVATRLSAAGPLVIVDLSGLDFMDCATLGIMVAARKAAREQGGDLVLSSPHGAVRRLLTVLKFPFRE